MSAHVMKYIISFVISLIIVFPSSLCLAEADKIFKDNHKAVVTIYAYDKYGIQFSQGSGFFIKNDGTLVTNQHVINSARIIKAKIGNKLLKVRPVYTSKKSDVALLKVIPKSKDIPILKLGDTSRVAIGDKVYVIGTPLGLEKTLSDGIVSAVRRFGDDRLRYIQFTAPISPGSSGGPVFNRNGEVIGIVAMTIRPIDFQPSQNLNLAIPIDLIKSKIALKGSFKEEAMLKIDRFFNHKGMFFFFVGGLIFLFLHKFNPIHRWFNFLHTLQHELIHLITAGLFGGAPVSMEVTTKGGIACTTKINFLVRISPYIFPLFSLFSMGISLLFSPAYKPLALVLAGIFYGNFIWKTFASLSHQPDIQSSKWKGAAYFFIVTANIALLILIGFIAKTT